MHVMIFTSAYPPIIGGAETFAAVVARGLADRGFEVTVVTDQVVGQPSVDSIVSGVTVHRLDRYSDALSDPSKLRWEQMFFGLNSELQDLLSWRPPDVVLANSLEMTVVGRMAASELGVPLVGTYHEHEPELEPLGFGKLTLGYRYLSPDLVLAGSKRYFERARRFLPAERVALIYHGVDTDTFVPIRAGAREKFGVATDELLVVCAGRFKPRKGQLVLTEALSLTKTSKTLRVILAGTVSSASSSYRDHILSTIRDRGLSDRIRLEESLEHQHMPELLAAADIVVQPSTDEGLGLSVLEAMSASRAVITGNVPGIDEILTRPGVAFVVDPASPESIARAIEELAERPALRERLGAAARQHVIEGFSQTAMLDRIADALRTVTQ